LSDEDRIRIETECIAEAFDAPHLLSTTQPARSPAP
jgi:hypothetical protein